MRTYIAQELIGTIWLIGAMLAASEKMMVVALIFLGWGSMYYLRAALTYQNRKAKEDARGKT